MVSSDVCPQCTGEDGCHTESCSHESRWTYGDCPECSESGHSGCYDAGVKAEQARIIEIIEAEMPHDGWTCGPDACDGCATIERMRDAIGRKGEAEA